MTRLATTQFTKRSPVHTQRSPSTPRVLASASPLCPALPSALLFSSSSPPNLSHSLSQSDGNQSLLHLLNIDTNAKQFVLHTRHTVNTNSCWEKASSIKVYMSAKVQHLHTHRARCRMYSTDFKGVPCDRMRDINTFKSTFRCMLYKCILWKYPWFTSGGLQPRNGFEWITHLTMHVGMLFVYLLWLRTR